MKMLTQFLFGTLLLSCFTLFGCATSGTVVVRSEPPGANVFFVDVSSGQNAMIGQTPLTFSKSEKSKDKDVIQIRIEKEGFEPKYSAVAAFGGQTTFVDVKLRTTAVAKGEIRDAFEAVRTLMAEANRYVLNKRFSEALSRVEKATELDPKSAEAVAAKGSVLFLMKDIEGARAAWSRALELNPGFQAVKDSLLQLSLQLQNVSSQNESARQPAADGAPSEAVQ